MKHSVKTRISYQGVVTQIPVYRCDSFLWIFKSTFLDSQQQNLNLFLVVRLFARLLPLDCV